MPEQTQPQGSNTRELALLDFITNQPNLDSLRNNPQAIISLIDEFARTTRLMTVGPEKSPIVTDLIAARRPSTMIELGCYIGYSALVFGDAVRRAGGSRYYSLELNPDYAAIATQLVELAGLGDFVRILVGRSDVLLHELVQGGEVSQVEILFIDHYKPAYTLDLKLCEQMGVIVPGVSVIAADNVIYPGNPPYLEYVKSSVEKKKREVQEKGAARAYTMEGFAERTVSAYMAKGENVPQFEIVGRPELVYESVLRQPEGYEDAIEVTRCVGVD
ncbi:S-adenosyl-L-methionine-dependent methyltransferase [Aspergillus aurantiobrunneus]